VGVIAASFTLATITMLGICWWAGRLTPKAGDVAAIAAIVAAFVAFSRVVSGFLDPPISMMFYPLQDALMVAICMAAFVAEREKWKSDLALCFLGQLVLHAWFWLGNDGSRDLLRSYIASNNYLFAGELVILTVAGGRHVLDHAHRGAGLSGRGHLVGG
jgi:hypothetical protein